MLVFEERRNRSTRRKPFSTEYKTNKLNPHMAPDLGIEPGLHWWGASALTTTPSLTLTKTYFNVIFTTPINLMILIHEGNIKFVLHSRIIQLTCRDNS